MKNLGKKFEENWRKSIPETEDIYYYRLKDGTANWSGGDNINVRFQANNIADAFMFHNSKIQNYGDLSVLLILELKHHHGKSLPLNCIRNNQLQEMLKASTKKNVVPLLIAFFSDVERCFSLDIRYVQKFIEENDRKSIPISYFEEKGVEIEVYKLKTNYRYNIEKWLVNF